MADKGNRGLAGTDNHLIWVDSLLNSLHRASLEVFQVNNQEDFRDNNHLSLAKVVINPNQEAATKDKTLANLEVIKANSNAEAIKAAHRKASLVLHLNSIHSFQDT